MILGLFNSRRTLRRSRVEIVSWETGPLNPTQAKYRLLLNQMHTAYTFEIWVNQAEKEYIEEMGPLLLLVEEWQPSDEYWRLVTLEKGEYQDEAGHRA